MARPPEEGATQMPRAAIGHTPVTRGTPPWRGQRCSPPLTGLQTTVLQLSSPSSSCARDPGPLRRSWRTVAPPTTCGTWRRAWATTSPCAGSAGNCTSPWHSHSVPSANANGWVMCFRATRGFYIRKDGLLAGSVLNPARRPSLLKPARTLDFPGQNRRGPQRTFINANCVSCSLN